MEKFISSHFSLEIRNFRGPDHAVGIAPPNEKWNSSVLLHQHMVWGLGISRPATIPGWGLERPGQGLLSRAGFSVGAAWCGCGKDGGT